MDLNQSPVTTTTKKANAKVIALDAPNTLRERLDCKEWADTEKITVMSQIGQKDIALLNGLAHSSLKEINLGDASVKSLDNCAFKDCHNLESITLPPCNVIPQELLKNCNSLTNVYISKQTTRIENHAFSDCTSLESITLPENITVIGAEVFKNCHKLKYVIVNAYFPPICSDSAFEGIPDYCTILIPSGRITEYSSDSHWNKFNIIEANKPIEKRF